MFREDGPLYKMMWTLADMFVINILWLVFSLPIVTIGASTAAAIEVNMRIVKKEESYIWKNFWSAFKKNFIDGTKLFFLLVIIVYFLYLNIQYFFISENLFQLAIISMAAIFTVLCYLYAFPLAVRYVNTTRRTLVNSMFFAIRWPLKTLITLVQVGILLFAYVFFSMILIFDDPGTGMGMFSMFVVVLLPEMILITLAYRGTKVIDAFKELEGQEADKEEAYASTDNFKN